VCECECVYEEGRGCVGCTVLIHRMSLDLAKTSLRTLRHVEDFSFFLRALCSLISLDRCG